MRNTFLVIGTLLFLSCSATTTYKPDNVVKKKKKVINPDHMSNAIEHFTNGKLLLSQGETQSALNEFYEALLYDQNSPEIYKSIAGILIDTEKYESAMININKSLKIDPNDVEAYSMLANCHLQLRKIPLAIENYQKILSIEPRHEKAFEMLLNLYDFTSNMKKANEIIQKYGENFPNNSNISYGIASTYFKQKKYALAKLWTDKSLAVDPEFEQAQLLSSEIDLVQGDGNEALQSLYQLYRKDPKNDRLLFNIVTVLRQQQKHNEIIKLLKDRPLLTDQLKLLLGESYYRIKSYRKTLNVYSNLPLNRADVYFLYIAADSEYRMQNYESSYAYYADIIKSKPTIAQGYYGAALCLIQQKNYDEAEKVLRTGLRRTKEHNALYQLLTETLVNLNRHNEANNYLAEIVKKNPKDMNTLASVANAYQKMNEFEKSDQIFEQALQLEPDNALILNNYSYSLSKRNIRLEEALQMIEKALVASPNNHHYLDTIGWVYFKLKKYEKARIFVEKAILMNPADDSYEVYDHLGDIYFALNNKSKALKYWTKAFEIDPKQTQIKEKIDKNK